jgi:hypothetical protein
MIATALSLCGADVPCIECQLGPKQGIRTYLVDITVGPDRLGIGPALCLSCVSRLGIAIQQNVRAKLKEPT